jgi:hypothetical protein
MSKTLKVLLGLVTLWPAAYIILFFAFVFSTIVSGGGNPVNPPLEFILIFVLHLFTMLVIAALTVFYIVNVFRNQRVEKDKKALWAVVLFMGSVIAMPVYWYLYFWKPAPETPMFSNPGQLGTADTSAWTNDVRAQASAAEKEYVPPAQPPDWR